MTPTKLRKATFTGSSTLLPTPIRKPPREMGASEVEDFLTHWAVDQTMAPSTQNQALSALIFLDREVYQRDTGWNLNADRLSPNSIAPPITPVAKILYPM